MKGFLLDTNVPSETVRPAPDARVVAWIEAQPLESLFLSVVSFGEWHKGLALLPPSKRRAELEEWLDMKVMKLFSGRILSMTEAIAGRWGALEGQRQRHRGEGYGRAAAGASAAQLPSGGAAGHRPDAEREGGRQQNEDTDGLTIPTGILAGARSRRRRVRGSGRRAATVASTTSTRRVTHSGR